MAMELLFLSITRRHDLLTEIIQEINPSSNKEERGNSRGRLYSGLAIHAWVRREDLGFNKVTYIYLHFYQYCNHHALLTRQDVCTRHGKGLAHYWT